MPVAAAAAVATDHGRDEFGGLRKRESESTPTMKGEVEASGAGALLAVLLGAAVRLVVGHSLD